MGEPKVRDFEGNESLVIERSELIRLLKTYESNELRAEDLMRSVKKEIKSLVEKNDDSSALKCAKAQLLALEYQKAKARGFKEAIDGLVYYFTGRMSNVENGKIITTNRRAS